MRSATAASASEVFILSFFPVRYFGLQDEHTLMKTEVWINKLSQLKYMLYLFLINAPKCAFFLYFLKPHCGNLVCLRFLTLSKHHRFLLLLMLLQADRQLQLLKTKKLRYLVVMWTSNGVSLKAMDVRLHCTRYTTEIFIQEIKIPGIKSMLPRSLDRCISRLSSVTRNTLFQCLLGMSWEKVPRHANGK